MKIHLIVAQFDQEWPWIVVAWDEWTEDENPDVREASMNIARRTCGSAAELRFAVVEVSDEFLDSVFAPYREEAR